METLNLYKHNSSVFSFKGDDLVDLLNRISTNTIPLNNSTVATFLLNEKGKIIDLLYIIQNNEDRFLILNNEETLNWIDKFTFTENYTISKSNFHLYEMIEEKDILNQEDVLFSLEDRQFIISSNNYPNSASLEDYKQYRINNHIQEFGFEINELYNPLEIGMINLIDFKKGCYTGQEVIARLEAFKKVSKYLVQIKLSYIEKPEFILLNESIMGKVTTINKLSNQALCIVHRSIAKVGQIVQIMNSDKTKSVIGEIEFVLDNKTYQRI